MLKSLLLICLLAMNSCMSAKTGIRSVLMSGRIMAAHQYCGGIAPSPEMIRQAETPVPYRGTLDFVNVAKPQLRYTFSSDDSGRFSLRLPAGKYQIMYPEVPNIKPDLHSQSKDMTQASYMEDCQRNYHPVLGSATVPLKGIRKARISIYIRCNPCGPSIP